MEAARGLYGDRISFCHDPYEAIAGADALVVMTEWLVYRNPDFERMRTLLARPLVLDGRNLYDPERMARLGLEYHGVGRRRM
jgi:UDPglucose 6-dehydrogenase